jgi:hypothetical protein
MLTFPTSPTATSSELVYAVKVHSYFMNTRVTAETLGDNVSPWSLLKFIDHRASRRLHRTSLLHMGDSSRNRQIRTRGGIYERPCVDSNTETDDGPDP